MVQIDIKNAKKLILEGINEPNSVKRNANYSSVHSFTTENLRGYYSQINFQNKQVLTVASSGDHMFNAILYGASKVDIFDINRLTKYYIELKKAAIATRDYNDFIGSFVKPNGFSFCEKEYNQISKYLDKNTKIFWDSLYQFFSPHNIKTSFLILTGSIEEYNPYLSKNNYYELQSKLTSFDYSFVESNITNLTNEMDNNIYDIILLSNISEIINKIYGQKALEKFKQLVLDISRKLNNNNGIIVLAYICGISEYIDENLRDTFYDSQKRDAIFNDRAFAIKYFESINPFYEIDGVMIYTK